MKKDNIALIWLKTFFVSVFAVSLFAVSLPFGNAAVKAYSETATTVTYSFDSEEELNDFVSVCVSEESGTAGEINEVNSNWVYNAERSAVKSKRTGTGTGSTGNVVSLYLTEYLFTCFRAEIVMDFDGDSSWGWGGLQFGKTQIDTGWRTDGCFAFAQREGYASLWGSNGFGGTAIDAKSISGAFDKNSPFLLRAEVFGGKCRVQVTTVDGGHVYSEIEYAFKTDDWNAEGFIGLQSVDNSHNFYSLSVTALDEKGNPTNLKHSGEVNAIEFENESTVVEVGVPQTLKLKNGVGNGNPLLVWDTNNKDVAIVKNGCVTGIKEGNASVYAYSLKDFYVSGEITLTFKKGEKTYVFDDALSLDGFKATKVINPNDQTAGAEKIDRHWEITKDKTLKKINLPINNAASDENFNCLYIAGRKFKDFEATIVYRNTSADAYGWIGVTSGATEFNKRFIEKGLGLFVQKEGIPTIWGDKHGLQEGKSGIYGINSWHAMKIKVYGETAEMYIDDMSAPAFTRNYDGGFSSGYVGIVTTGMAQYEIASFAVYPLTQSGEYTDFSAITAVSIKEKNAGAVVGDKRKLELNVVGECEVMPEFKLVSSDNNVAFIREDVIYFISEGEVTLTVYCEDDKRLTDSFTVSVRSDGNDEKRYHYDSGNASDNSSETSENGCGGSLAAGLNGAALLAVISGIVIYQRKRKV